MFLAAVLCDVGDRFFSSCLNAEPGGTRCASCGSNCSRISGQDESQDAQKALDQTKDMFPETFARNRTPRVSQPATAGQTVRVVARRDIRAGPV